ncbi:rhomboid family intramembrane serine protease [Neolewinella lacunae]|uniref:Rhomboid family intramembrane serine protease n=1 Tax=Neolewinella lacunae TaxID=1517758 RepID=A0A923TA72_9BACT|nr:rhomboid family intramembrane serine protease [Neolewinella lacunae]MBC6996249.1 rhomboid family intramembrane serine protease [Neolewinella lacunae]MDN3636872.1 rhomboid family intramembrane serine protease [Neolewinella lacunae]
MLPPPTPIVRYLLILNAIIFAVVVLPGQLGYNLAIEEKLALYYWTSDNFRPYQLLSHFFMHADFGHIFFNLLVLYFFGPELETRLGGVRFLILYFLAAFGAVGLHLGQIWWQVSESEAAMLAFSVEPSLANFNAFWSGVDLEGYSIYGRAMQVVVGETQNDLVMLKDPSLAIAEATKLMQEYTWLQENSRMVGASGAISGVMAAYAVFYPWKEIHMLFIPFGIPALFLIGGTFLADLFLGIMDYNYDTTARFAHVGGGIVGALLALVWRKTVLPPWLKRIDK